MIAPFIQPKLQHAVIVSCRRAIHTVDNFLQTAAHNRVALHDQTAPFRLHRQDIARTAILEFKQWGKLTIADN